MGYTTRLSAEQAAHLHDERRRPSGPSGSCSSGMKHGPPSPANCALKCAARASKTPSRCATAAAASAALAAAASALAAGGADSGASAAMQPAYTATRVSARADLERSVAGLGSVGRAATRRVHESALLLAVSTTCTHERGSLSGHRSAATAS